MHSIQRTRRRRVAGVTGVIAATAMTLSLLGCASATSARTAETFPSDAAQPDLVTLLSGENQFWQSDGLDDLHGTIKDPAVLRHNDRLEVWINHHATVRQQFKAMQDSEFNDDGNAYDESITDSTALGSKLGPIYVRGRESGALPLTDALINSEDGTTGNFVSTSTAKAFYSYPRPYLATAPNAQPVAGDGPLCAPMLENGSSLESIRAGQPYADAAGNLKIVRVADVTDTTHEFSPNDVALNAGYGQPGLCQGGSFPSGHTTNTYEAGLTLATLLPRLAPEVLARTSEQGTDRLVLGVHYPLDIMGGRISGEVAAAARWSDPAYVSEVLRPARHELLTYLRSKCGTIGHCVATEQAYRDNPFGGARMPGGTAEIVTNRASALKVFEQRLTYGFRKTGAAGQAPSVPAGAQNLLLTTFPTLSDAQRIAVLAQTEITSGFPLDGTGTPGGSWERLDLAAAMSAHVLVHNGAVKVQSVGGMPKVVHHAKHHHHH
jgi:membrane-associated phospholipid phosphatase